MMLAEMDAVYRMAFHLSRHPDEAGDLTQETYLRALKAEGSFELRERGMRPWLFKILHNVFYSRITKQKRQPASLQPEQDEIAGGDDTMAAPAWDLATLNWEQVDDRLKHAIEQLPVAYREVLLLWAVEGLRYREIAEVMDVPLGTIMSRLYRARGILAEQLADLARENGIKVNASGISSD